jgi:hypothetical protein
VVVGTAVDVAGIVWDAGAAVDFAPPRVTRNAATAATRSTATAVAATHTR